MIQTNTVGQHTELQVIGGGKWLTLNRPTNFHEFYKTRILLPGENIEDYKEVTDAEKATIEAEDAAWVEPPQAFIDQWNEACKYYSAYGNKNYGGYYPGEAEDPHKPFKLNDIWLTYQEAMRIFEMLPVCKRWQGGGSLFRNNNGVRTLFPIMIANGDTYSYRGMFCDCRNIEKIVFLQYGTPTITDASWLFQHCLKLKTVVGTLYLSRTSTYSIFAKCSELRDITISTAVSLNISPCPKLTYKSVNYLVTKASNTATITITVHPNVYAKLTGDTTNAAAAELTEEEAAQWQALVEMAADKNIQFATT